ncbi:hypothetical protein [Novacetimonas hansenii]|uniref:hypothetical protein n=1 Tax=Novacetimonas hansenii TaxID=436 RepID=UPI000AF15D12|nr:hypothetical protein [Novacetimonas hansenii]
MPDPATGGKAVSALPPVKMFREKAASGSFCLQAFYIDVCVKMPFATTHQEKQSKYSPPYPKNGSIFNII